MKYYRISEIGTCPRAITAERLKMPGEQKPAWLETSAREGKRHEQWLREDLVAEGYDVHHAPVCQQCLRQGQEREGIHTELSRGDIQLVGHIDAKATRDNELFGVEFKTMSQYEFERWMSGKFNEFKSYEWQVSAYMEAEVLPWIYWVKNRSSGYIDKLPILQEPPISADTIFSRLEQVEDCIAHGILFPAEYDANSIECKRCDYKLQCIKHLDIKLQDRPKLEEAVENWRRGKAMQKEAYTLVDDAEELFKLQSKALETNKWTFEELSISFSEKKEGSHWDGEYLGEVLTKEQLEIAKVPNKQDPTGYIRIYDLANKKNKGD